MTARVMDASASNVDVQQSRFHEQHEEGDEKFMASSVLRAVRGTEKEQERAQPTTGKKEHSPQQARKSTADSK